ncbi:MAG: dihydropyrimidinase [Pseudomonadota bacterium]
MVVTARSLRRIAAQWQVAVIATGLALRPAPPAPIIAGMSTPYDLILRGGTAWGASGPIAGDIAVRGGRIVAMGEIAGDATRVIDASGKLILPGGVDVHAHIEQRSGMGVMNADTFETATRSAALGGTTSVISFAAQAKGQSLSEAVAEYQARARRGAAIDHAFHIMVTDPTVPGFADDLRALVEAGHRSVKVFTTYDIRLDDGEILDVMYILREVGALLCIHAETHAIIASATRRLLAEGKTAPHHHAASHPRMAEIEAVGRMIRFAELTGQPIMLFHLSTPEAADAVRGARRRGIPVWAETCPHYLLMAEEVLHQDGAAKWMCSPPQRSTADCAHLWEAIGRDDIQLISSDHAPYRADATGKFVNGTDVPFTKIANGMPGLETRLPLIFDAVVSRGRGTVADFVRLTAKAPARLYGLAGKGDLRPGCDADLLVWDPARQVTYGDDDLHDNVGYNPWTGHTVTGWPETVILRGEVIAEDGAFHGQPGQGNWIKRPADAGAWAKEATR